MSSSLILLVVILSLLVCSTDSISSRQPIVASALVKGVVNNNNRRNRAVINFRGGKKPNKKEIDSKKDDATDSNDENSDDSFDDEDIDQLDLGDSGSSAMLSSVSEIWSKTPPMTQVYLFGTMFISILSFILNKNKWPEVLHFEWKPILTGFQFWRIFTAFLYFGPVGLNYILTLQFVWQYMSHLEKMNYNKPEEFLVLLLFGGISLIGCYSILGISMKFLGHNLAAYLVYIWSRLFEGTDVNVMDLITLKSETIPWFFAAQTLILDGEIPYADLLGIAVGHLYHYLKQKDVVKAPSFIKEWFSSEEMQRKYSRFKDDFE